MNDEQPADRADLERVLRDIATNRGAAARDRVLAAASLRILKHTSYTEPGPSNAVAELWRYRGGESNGSRDE